MSASSAAATPDTTRYRSQYTLSAGYAAGPFRASFTQRYRTGLFLRVATPSARIGYDTRFLTLSAIGDGRSLDSTRRVEASAVIRPLSFVYLSGAVGGEQANVGADTTSLRQFSRAEGGIRVFDVWMSGGILTREATPLKAPRIFSRDFRDTADVAAQAVYATIRGRVWKAVYVDLQGVQWSDTGSLYRPRYQTRSEVYVSTSLLDKIPSGNFHLLASAVHEYRSSTVWPTSADPIRVAGYRTVSTLLQVRIVSAELFWNFRNILGERYEQIPGYGLPRLTNIYGVRWEFWN